MVCECVRVCILPKPQTLTCMYNVSGVLIANCQCSSARQSTTPRPVEGELQGSVWDLVIRLASWQRAACIVYEAFQCMCNVHVYCDTEGVQIRMSRSVDYQ